MERPTKTVKLEIYEDQEDEFRALIWYLKKALNNDHVINKIKRNYTDPLIYQNFSEPYLQFLQKLIGMIRIPSLDENTFVPSFQVSPVPFRKINPEYFSHLNKDINDFKDDDVVVFDLNDTSNSDTANSLDKNYNTETKKIQPPAETMKLVDDVFEFINSSTKLSKLLPEKLKWELVSFFVDNILKRKVKKYQVDKFWLAARDKRPTSYSVHNDIDILISSAYDFRHDPNIVFHESPAQSNRKLSTKEKYRLAGDIHYHLSFQLKMLPENSYQLNVLTGYMLAHIGVLKDEDEFLKNPKGSETWREYLAKYANNWVKKAYELGYEIDSLEEE